MSRKLPTNNEQLIPNAESFTPQVPANSYDFAKYMTMPRWCSLWHQIRIIQSLQPKTILEVGVGNGLLRAICSHQGIEVRTIDIDPELGPDVVASVQKIPFEPQSVDLSCAFQVLEHMPYEESLQGFRELCRVSRQDVVISLPNAQRAYPQSLSLPILRKLKFIIPGSAWPYSKMIKSHFWEIGRPGTTLKTLIHDFSQVADLVSTFRVHENPYHQFFHFRCTNRSTH